MHTLNTLVRFLGYKSWREFYVRTSVPVALDASVLGPGAKATEETRGEAAPTRVAGGALAMAATMLLAEAPGRR